MPPDILEKMREENDEYEGTRFTPSTLLECDRRTALYTSRDHWLDVEKAWNIHRGNAVHRYMERLPFPAGEVHTLVREKRLTTTVETAYGPQLISGKMDLVVVKTIEAGAARCKVVDYKSKEIKDSLTSPDQKHVNQINIYRWLVQESLLDLGLDCLSGVDRIEVDELEICYVDMKKWRRFSSVGPRTSIGTKPRGGTEPRTLYLDAIPLYDPAEVEKWVASRIEDKIRAEELLPSRENMLGSLVEPWLCNYCPMYEACCSHP
jgi:hypothetical protein